MTPLDKGGQMNNVEERRELRSWRTDRYDIKVELENASHKAKTEHKEVQLAGKGGFQGEYGSSRWER